MLAHLLLHQFATANFLVVAWLLACFLIDSDTRDPLG
jgi:hypothetical protein